MKIKRPLLALAVRNGDVHSVLFHSLTDNETVTEINFDYKISDIQSNGSIIAIGLKDACKIVLVDNATLKKKEEEILCWREAEHPKSKPIFALGSKFIAFQTLNTESEIRMVTSNKHSDNEDDDIETDNYAAWNVDMKNVMRKMVYTGTKIYSSFVDSGQGKGSFPSPQRNKYGQPGYVQIMDTDSYMRVNFFAAESGSISVMKFDRSGLLLLTSPEGSQVSNIWPVFPNYKNNIPFYILHHGHMFRKIKDVHFNENSTFVSIISKSGSIHIYPIQPNGTTANAYTHLEKKRIVEEFSLKHETHSPSELVRLSSKGAMCAYLFPFPIRRGSSDKKKISQAKNHCCLVFNSDGILARYDLALKKQDIRVDRKSVV